MYCYTVHLCLSAQGSTSLHMFEVDATRPYSEDDVRVLVLDTMQALQLSFVELASAYVEPTGKYYSVSNMSLPSPAVQ